LVPDHDVLTAGFPCQPFSKAGDRLGFKDTAQGNLFFKVLQILEVKRPKRFILENVPNILTHDGGRTKETIITTLGALGYAVDVRHFSPDQFGIPQVRDRAYFVGSLDGLDDFNWPAPRKAATDIISVLHDDVTIARRVPDLTLTAIDMWGDFLARSPEEVKLPSFPIWAMEFGATYPYEAETPAGVWKRRPTWGLRQMNVTGTFGFTLDGLTISEQKPLIPSHARRENELEFPRWKRQYIRQNRDFYKGNRKWIDPWLNEWQPWDLPSSFQKMEWNAQGEERVIDNFVIQVRASGIRIKRPKTAPSLIAFTQTQVPILGANLAGQRRYMTPQECAELQSLGSIKLPVRDLDAYKALGNAVNARVVKAIAQPLLQGLRLRKATSRTNLHTQAKNDLDALGATA
jgi:DNA (cytosine-5)-methyltransferase 1